MIQVRRARDRGHFNYRWLETFHTFSFGRYYDPAHRGFGTLRVINEDRVAPGKGFAEHGHENMEIVTYVLSGELEHRDSLGNGEILKAGEVQRMSAGTGIRHSEFNPATEQLHLYQIWIEPAESDLSPGYEQKWFDPADRDNRWQTIVTSEGGQGALTIGQDCTLSLANLDGSAPLLHSLQANRSAWLQVLRGEVEVNAVAMQAGDGAAITGEPALTLTSSGRAEVLLFDLA